MSKGLKALECIKQKLSALEFVLGHDRIPKKAPYIQETIFHVIEEELRVLDILHKHIKWQGSLQYVLSMSKYWEKERKSITQERLDLWDFPFTVDEFETIARWLRRREELE